MAASVQEEGNLAGADSVSIARVEERLSRDVSVRVDAGVQVGADFEIGSFFEAGETAL